MRFSIQLSKFHRYSVYIVWCVLSISGLYFFYVQDWQMQEPNQWSLWSLKTHGIFAAAMIFLIGSIVPVHIKLSLKIKRNVSSGLTLLTIMIILILTGVGLYYSPEEWHELVKWLHIGIGIFAILLLPLHIVIGYLSRFNQKQKTKQNIV